MNYKKMAEDALNDAMAYNNEVRVIAHDPDLSDAEKRAKIDELLLKGDEKRAEARSHIERGEREAEVRKLAEERGYLMPSGGVEARAKVNRPLSKDASFADVVGRAAQPGEFGDFMRGLIFGESRAMGESVDANGGFAVPTHLSARVLDLARNKAQVLRAGATLVPMDTKEVTVAKVATDPDATWRDEHDAITESGMTLGPVTLTARSAASLIKISWELAEDASSNLEAVVENALAQAFALKLDKAALYGSGVAPEPGGIKVASGVTLTELGAGNGAAVSWSPLVAAVRRIRAANYDPRGVILSERTEADLSELTDNNGQYLRAPDYLTNVSRYATSQVPDDLTVGTSVNTSDAFVGDFSNLYVGIRTSFQVRILREKYADNGELGIVGWMRSDIQVARADAFEVITGITPAA